MPLRIHFSNADFEFDPKPEPLYIGKFSAIFILENNNSRIICKIAKPDLHPFEKERFIQQKEIWDKMYPQYPSKIEFSDNSILFIRNFIEGNDLKNLPRHSNIEHALLEALKEIHKLHTFNYLCTDVKPSNFLLTSTNQVMLIDFGASIPLNFQQPKNYKIPFTFLYAPPEMILHRFDLCNTSSDYYMWALMAFHLLTQKVPFENPNPVLLMHQQLNSFPDYKLVKNKKWREWIEALTFKITFPKPPNLMNRYQIEEILVQTTMQRNEIATPVVNSILQH